jgi:hypothetical protein
MNEELMEIMVNSSIGEPEIVEFLYVYKKLVDINVLSKDNFISDLAKLNVQWDGDKQFKLSDNVEYVFN